MICNGNDRMFHDYSDMYVYRTQILTAENEERCSFNIGKITWRLEHTCSLILWRWRLISCKKLKDIHVPSFELNDNILPRVNQCKHLGHVITDDPKDDNDSKAVGILRIIYAQGNALIRKFYMCSDHVKCRPTLFRSFCTSLYTFQLWCYYKSESIRKLYVAYNNVFRLLCNEPRYCSASYMFVTRGKMWHLQNVN